MDALWSEWPTTNLNDSIGDLGGWDNGVGSHHSVRVLLADLRNQQGSHSGASTTTEGVGDLEPWKTESASISLRS